MAALFLRHLPALARLGGILRERMLGRLAGASATFAHPGVLEGWFDGPRAWMRDTARAGVGGFGDLALHLVDAFSVLPADEPPRLAAVAYDRGTGSRGDVGGIGLGTWAGVPITVQASWAVRPGGLELLVTGAAGTATVRGGTLEVVRGGGTPERWVGAPPDAGEAVRGFAASLRSGRFPGDGLAPAVRAQEVLEAAVRVA
jgi:predicted dehydrogenase